MVARDEVRASLAVNVRVPAPARLLPGSALVPCRSGDSAETLPRAVGWPRHHAHRALPPAQPESEPDVEGRVDMNPARAAGPAPLRLVGESRSAEQVDDDQERACQ